MKHTKGFLLAATAAAIFCSCKTSQKTARSAAGTWQPQPVVIDGNNSDWPAPYPFYDDKAKLGYAVSNDKDNLYITMQTGDQMTIMKILRNGLTVWIDTNGQKEMHASITYPMENTNGGGMRMQRGNGQEQPERPAAEEMHRKILENARDMSLAGFNGCNGGFLIQQNNSCGIAVRIGFDEYNTLVWEAAVPFHALYKNSLTAADAGKPVSVCFTVTGLKEPSGGGGQGGGGMHAGGGGGMRGGGMHGGGGGMRGGSMNGGGMSGDREHLFKSTKTWYHTGLAFKAG